MRDSSREGERETGKERGMDGKRTREREGGRVRWGRNREREGGRERWMEGERERGRESEWGVGKEGLRDTQREREGWKKGRREGRDHYIHLYCLPA